MKLEYKNKKYQTIKQVFRNEFDISNRLITKLKENKCIYKNGQSVSINTIISKDDLIVIDLDFPEDENENILPVKMSLNIIYEDDGLLIINKPPNMPVHPSILHFQDTLSNGIRYYFNEKHISKKIRPVNRLDKDTSGIVIFAKNQYIQECLIKQMNNNQFYKEYYAILEGNLDEKKGTINASISRKPNSIIEREINADGENAITHFELIENFEENSKKLAFVKFVLETGRTHQIRVHSKYIGHPILGDTLYGKKSELTNRQMLHSYKVKFINPISKQKQTIETSIPDDMKKIIEGI